jgi:uncharacterized protein (DUF3084 family)
LETHERLTRLVEPLKQQRSSRKQHLALLTEQSAELGTRLSGVEQKLESLFDQEKSLMAERLQKQASSEQARLLHGRVASKHKRIEIEIRNVIEAARRVVGPGGGDMPAGEGKKLTELEAQSGALQPELAAAQSALSAATAAVAKIDRALEALARERAKAEKERRDETQRSSGALKEKEKGLLAADKELAEATRDLGCAVLHLRGEVPVPKELREAIALADERVHGALSAREELSAALQSYDADAFVKGVWVSSLGALALCVLLLWPLL